MKSKKVYITHLSAVSSLGLSPGESLENMKNGHVPLTIPGKNDRYVRPYFKVAGPDKKCGYIRSSQLAVLALEKLNMAWPGAIPLFTGTSTGGIFDTEKNYEILTAHGRTAYSPMSQFFNQITDDVLKEFKGKISRGMSFSTACSSSGHALLFAYRMIKHNLFPRAVVLGVDSLSLTTMTGFDSLKLVSEKGTIPLSKERDGLSLGEGAGVLVLDSEPSGPVLAEITGAASSSDGYHISSPDPLGTSQKECILSALKESGIGAKSIDYINTHGTGTIINDEVEMKVISELFPHNPVVTSLKGFTGHTLGASTALEIALVLLMAGQGKIYQYPGLDSPINPAMIPSKTVEKKTGYFLKNSFGFGGNNVSLVINSKV